MRAPRTPAPVPDLLLDEGQAPARPVPHACGAMLASSPPPPQLAVSPMPPPMPLNPPLQNIERTFAPPSPPPATTVVEVPEGGAPAPPLADYASLQANTIALATAQDEDTTVTVTSDNYVYARVGTAWYGPLNADAQHLVRRRSVPRNPHVARFQGALLVVWTEHANFDGSVSMFSPWRGYLAYSLLRPGEAAFTAPRLLLSPYETGSFYDDAQGFEEWYLVRDRGRMDHWVRRLEVSGDRVMILTHDNLAETQWLFRGTFDLQRPDAANFGRPIRWPMEDVTCRGQWCFTLDLTDAGRLNIRASSNGGEDWIFLGPAPENQGESVPSARRTRTQGAPHREHPRALDPPDARPLHGLLPRREGLRLRGAAVPHQRLRRQATPHLPPRRQPPRLRVDLPRGPHETARVAHGLRRRDRRRQLPRALPGSDAHRRPAGRRALRPHHDAVHRRRHLRSLPPRDDRGRPALHGGRHLAAAAPGEPYDVAFGADGEVVVATSMLRHRAGGAPLAPTLPDARAIEDANSILKRRLTETSNASSTGKVVTHVMGCYDLQHATMADSREIVLASGTLSSSSSSQSAYEWKTAYATDTPSDHPTLPLLYSERDVRIDSSNGSHLDLVFQVPRGPDRVFVVSDAYETSHRMADLAWLTTALPPRVVNPLLKPPGFHDDVATVLGTDACATAFNGVCEDGGIGSVSESCVFGTDTHDCGTRAAADAVCNNACAYAYDGWCDDGSLIRDEDELRFYLADAATRAKAPTDAFLGPRPTPRTPRSSFLAKCAHGSDCYDCGIRPTRPPPSPPTFPPMEVPFCDNTCFWANDGVCDDGSPSALKPDEPWRAVCAHGTDCGDCGPRHQPACSDTCATWGNGICEDGDPLNAANDKCMFGTDCSDCGARLSTHPAPPPAPPSWIQVEGLGCRADGDCVRTAGFPVEYPGDSECTIRGIQNKTLDVRSFWSELHEDVLTVDGVEYSGVATVTYQLQGHVALTDIVTWRTSRFVSAQGWEICFRDAETFEAENPPELVDDPREEYLLEGDCVWQPWTSHDEPACFQTLDYPARIVNQTCKISRLDGATFSAKADHYLAETTSDLADTAPHNRFVATNIPIWLDTEPGVRVGTTLGGHIHQSHMGPLLYSTGYTVDVNLALEGAKADNLPIPLMYHDIYALHIDPAKITSVASLPGISMCVHTGSVYPRFARESWKSAMGLHIDGEGCEVSSEDTSCVQSNGFPNPYAPLDKCTVSTTERLRRIAPNEIASRYNLDMSADWGHRYYGTSYPGEDCWEGQISNNPYHDRSTITSLARCLAECDANRTAKWQHTIKGDIRYIIVFHVNTGTPIGSAIPTSIRVFNRIITPRLGVIMRRMLTQILACIKPSISTKGRPKTPRSMSASSRPNPRRMPSRSRPRMAR